VPLLLEKEPRLWYPIIELLCLTGDVMRILDSGEMYLESIYVLTMGGNPLFQKMFANI